MKYINIFISVKLRKSTYTIFILLFLLVGMQDAYAAKTRRKRPPSSSKTSDSSSSSTSDKKTSSSSKSKKKKSKKSSSGKSLKVLVSQADSLFIVGDSAGVANGFFKFVEDCDTITDTQALDYVLWSIEYQIEHGNVEKAIKAIDKIGKPDSSLVPKIDIIRIKVFTSSGHAGKAYMMSRIMENRYAGTDWENRARAMVNYCEKGITVIPLAGGSAPIDTSRTEKPPTPTDTSKAKQKPKPKEVPEPAETSKSDEQGKLEGTSEYEPTEEPSRPELRPEEDSDLPPRPIYEG